MAVCVVTTADGAETARTLIAQRPATGLLASMWEFAVVEVADAAQAPRALEARVEALMGSRLSASAMTKVGEETHIFTHRVWRMLIYRARCDGPPPAASAAAAVSPSSSGSATQWVSAASNRPLLASGNACRLAHTPR